MNNTDNCSTDTVVQPSNKPHISRLLAGVAIVAALCLLLVALAACSAEKTLNGTYEGESMFADGSAAIVTLAFARDGQITFTATSFSGELLYTYLGTYTISEDSIEFVWQDVGSGSLSFAQDGDTLNIGGIEYKKVK